MLDDIIAILVMDKFLGASNDFRQDWSDLIMFAVLQDTLNDSTAIRVHCQLHDLTDEILHNKLHSLRRRAFDTFLYNMVSILISHALHDISL